MSEKNRIIIVAIESNSGDEEVMRRETESRTGSSDIFFCPGVRKGARYQGHAHVSLPFGATEASNDPIETD